MTASVWINGVKLPINPPEIRYKLPSDNQRYKLLGIGEVNVLRDAKLAEVTFEGVLPPHDIPGVDNGAMLPTDYIRQWRDIMDAKEPVGFVYIGDGWDIVMTASIEGLDYREKGGAVGWLEYTINTVKWVPYAAKKVILPQSTGVVAGKPRTEEAPPAAAMEKKKTGVKKQQSEPVYYEDVWTDEAMREFKAQAKMRYSIPVSTKLPQASAIRARAGMIHNLK